MQHLPAYWIDGGKKLALDAGISSSSVYHILHNRNAPSYRIAMAITDAISTTVGREILPTEIFSITGTYPTPSVCSFFNCKCLPEAAYTEDDRRKPQYRHLKGGDWHTVDHHNVEEVYGE